MAMNDGTGNGTSARSASRTDTLDVRSIVDTVREPLLVLDRHLRVQSANRSFYRTFQVLPQDTEGRLLYDLGNRQWDIPRLRTLLEEILPHDTVVDDFELTHDFPDIGHKVMLLNARRLPQEGDDRILLALEDVTERRRAERERHEIETRFTALVKNIQDHSIFTLDPQGRVTSWNVAAEHILGYAEAEALGRHFAFIFTAEDREQGVPEAELRAARESGRADDERWHLRKNGERFWALGIVSALHDTDGRLTGFSKILRDMTDWKQSQEVMQASVRRLSMVLDSAYIMAFEWDIPRNEVRRHHSRLGAAPETPEERPSNLEAFCDAVHPDDRERFLANLHDALAHPEDGYRAEFRVCEPGGQIVWVAEHGYLECDEQGQPQRLIGLSQDITERKETEARLRAARDAFRQVVDQSPFGVYTVDTDFRLMQISVGAQSAFRNVRPLIGRDFGEVLRLLWPEPFASELIARFRHTLATGEPYHAPTTILRRWGDAGSESYDWKIERITLADGRPGVVCHFYDLSERYGYEEALRESEARFRTMADGLPLMVWVHDARSHQEFVNRTFCEFFDVSAEEAAGDGWKTLMHPDDAAAYVTEFQECVRAQRPFHAEVRVQAADGKWHWLESWGRP
ncbi:PAS domain-containing protein, partial [Guyparkeria sp.]|uniref:PAS domain-containing protein n=1 Tax=Chromatiales TaxID=135613 RepID=UPI0035654F02